MDFLKEHTSLWLGFFGYFIELFSLSQPYEDITNSQQLSFARGY